MPGRKKFGYLLLLFLVLSGLAGAPTNNSLTKKERMFAADFLKATRSELLVTLKGLTPKQLDYKKTKNSVSIKEYVYQLVFTDKKLREFLDQAMSLPANPEKRSEIIYSDDQLINITGQPIDAGILAKSYKPEKKQYKSVEQALNELKTSRMQHIKYIKATSEDLRNHIVYTPIGWLDAYQVCLLISAQTNYFVSELKKVKAQPGFPG
jgi:hypothetical protein